MKPLHCNVPQSPRWVLGSLSDGDHAWSDCSYLSTTAQKFSVLDPAHFLRALFLVMTVIVCTPSFCWGDWTSYRIFEKGGELDRTLILRGRLLEKRGVTFLRGLHFLQKKKKMKYLMTKNFINKNIFLCHK